MARGMVLQGSWAQDVQNVPTRTQTRRPRVPGSEASVHNITKYVQYKMVAYKKPQLSNEPFGGREAAPKKYVAKFGFT